MTAVATLCSQPMFAVPGSSPQTNPFFDHIQFNDYSTPSNPAPGGFGYDCAAMANLFYKYYFSQPLNAGISRLGPPDFATEFLLAHDALRKVVSMPQSDSVYFGDPAHAQGIMQEAFIAGVSARLLASGPPGPCSYC